MDEFIMEKCYSELRRVLLEAETDENSEYTPAGLEQIRAAVQHECEREAKNLPEPQPAESEFGRDLEKRMDLLSVVANRAVRRRAKEILESDAGGEGKSQ
jgi:hypothetical protein